MTRADHDSPRYPTPHGWTPGPWQWFGNAEHGEPYLATVHGGRVFVLNTSAEVTSCQCCDTYDSDTEEYTHGCDTESHHSARARLRFQVDQRMVNAERLAKYEVIGYQTADKDDERLYRHDYAGIDHPDAKLIAMAPTMAAAILQFYMVENPTHDHYEDPSECDTCTLLQIAEELTAIGGASNE